jgi:biotin carboxyl carrier protein
MTQDPTPPSDLSAPASAVPAPARKGMSKRATYLVLLIAVSFVLMPFLFWRASWFGAPMSPSDISQALAPGAEPRKTQHALAQLSTRMDRGDASARQWYPGIVTAAKHPDPQIRLTAAWVMGRDNTAPEFHQALAAMLADPDAMVRDNAALALVRFHDDSGRPQLLAMLQPFTVTAPAALPAGTLRPRLKEKDAVRSGTLVARIDTPQGVVEVRSPVPGTLQRWLGAAGAPVSAGQPLCVLAPDAQAAWEALRGLYLVGRAEDAPVVETFLRNSGDLPANVAEQARQTLQAIESRK